MSYIICSQETEFVKDSSGTPVPTTVDRKIMQVGTEAEKDDALLRLSRIYKTLVVKTA